MNRPIVVDFETEAIVGNPIINPPKSTGCAVWVPGQEPFYMDWGHPEFEVGDPRYPKGSKRNIYYGDAHEYLKKIRDSGEPVLFHNAPFDLSVWNNDFCNSVWDIRRDWKRIHDTLYLVFLADPYAPTFSLKPSADRWLGMLPTEQHELMEWIVANVPGATTKNFGAYISRAPGDLVGSYAIGDVVRTGKLFELLHAKIVEDGMEAAYDRERALLPTLYSSTRRGIRIDRNLLDHHTGVYSTCLEMAKDSLVEHLGASRDIFEHDDLLADALDRVGAVKEWVYTPKSGKRSMSKENLKIIDPTVKGYMDYIGRLETCLSMFMRPWLEYSEKDGRLHPNWNQVRQSRGSFDDSKGARTGRLSSDSPNFQNVPTEFEDNTGTPLWTPPGLHPLPMLRRYCLPEPGHVWLKRDYSSQEIRILAHFEDGSLCEAYRANPSLDPHQMARNLITQMIGITYSRPHIKITGFSLIYGSGVTGIARKLGCSYEDGYAIKEAYLNAMPDVRTLMDDVKLRGKSGSSIRTWGGRIYFREPSKEIEGRMRDFSYKLLNYLIQGSAADQTKQAIIDWAGRDYRKSIFLATVHDEINISAPEECWEEEMKYLKETMNADRLDVPVLSEGFKGPNWADIEEVA